MSEHPDEPLTTPYPARRRWLHPGRELRLRMGVRLASVLLLSVAIGTGLVRGGYLDYEGSPWQMLPGKAAGVVGMAAEDITISGLEHHDPEVLLAAIGVMPGGSLFGFDATQAKRTLEHLDWIESASVQRRFPNQLVIAVSERAPFAVWQRDRSYYVIDSTGAAMSGLAASHLVKLPLVTGEGANLAAAELINALEAYPDLLLQVRAAARVGNRRWTLYLDSGVTVLLPERGWAKAIATVNGLNRSQQLLSKGIRAIDLRLDGRLTVEVAELKVEADETHKTAPADGQ